MYVRPPNNVKSGMKIPENYSGNAFSRGAGIADMPPPARMQTPRQDIPHSDISPEELREKAHAYTSEEISEPSSYEKQKEIAEPDATVPLAERKYFLAFSLWARNRKRGDTYPCSYAYGLSIRWRKGRGG